MNWKEYSHSNNPVAAALLMVKMELNPARTRFIYDFFEKHLVLNQSEEKELFKEKLDD